MILARSRMRLWYRAIAVALAIWAWLAGADPSPASKDASTRASASATGAAAATTATSQPVLPANASATLPFAPHDLRPSSDGTRVVALQFAPSNDLSTPGPLVGVGYVALVAWDGTTAKTVAHRAVPDKPTIAAADADHVYVACLNRDQVLVLSGKDLHEERTIALEGTPVSVAVVMGRLFIGYEGPLGRMFGVRRAVYQLPQLTPCDDPLPGMPPERNRQIPELGGFQRDGIGFPLDAGDGNWVYGGVILDHTLRHARMLMAGEPFVRLTPQARYDADEAINRWAPWDVHLMNGMLSRTGGQNVMRLPDGFDFTNPRKLTIHPNVPALVIPQLSGNSYAVSGRTQRMTSSIKLVDLVNGASAAALIVVARDVPFPINGGDVPVRWGTTPASLIRAAGSSGALVMATGDQVTFVPGQRLQAAAQFAEPLHFLIDAGRIPTFEPTTKLNVIARVRGGAPPLRFELDANPQGIEVDAQSGTVTLDGSTLVTGAREDLRKALFGYKSAPGRGNADSSIKSLAEEYQRLVTPMFRALVGREPKGLPVAVRVTLVVRDANAQTVFLNQHVLLEVPAGDVVRYVEDQAAAASELSKRSAETRIDTVALQKRVLELEQMNRELQRQLDGLLEQANRIQLTGVEGDHRAMTRPATQRSSGER